MDKLFELFNKLLRETFFQNQTRVFSDVITSTVSDFMIDNMTFEVGGKNKGQRQIQGIENGFIVKDDIESGSAHRNFHQQQG